MASLSGYITAQVVMAGLYGCSVDEMTPLLTHKDESNSC